MIARSRAAEDRRFAGPGPDPRLQSHLVALAKHHPQLHPRVLETFGRDVERPIPGNRKCLLHAEAPFRSEIRERPVVAVAEQLLQMRKQSLHAIVDSRLRGRRVLGRTLELAPLSWRRNRRTTGALG